MAMDAYKNFAVGTVVTPPSPASSGTTLVVAAGQGPRFPATPFNASVWPTGVLADPTNAEIVRVTNITSDTLTFTRTQEGTAARAIIAGDLIVAGITKKTLDDLATVTGANVVRELDLPIAGLDPPDYSGTVINAPPLLVRRISTGAQTASAPKVVETLAQFTGANQEVGIWSWTLPNDYVSGGALIATWSMISAVSGNVVIIAGCAIPAAGADGRALSFNTPTNTGNLSPPTTLGATVDTTITLTMTNAAAGRKIIFFVHFAGGSAG